MNKESFLPKEDNQPAEDRLAFVSGQVPRESDAGCQDKVSKRITVLQFFGQKEK